VPRERHFWCLFALLLFFLVAFLVVQLIDTVGRLTENETPRHAPKKSEEIGYEYWYRS